MNTRAGELELPAHNPAIPRLVSAAEGYECWAATYDRDQNPLLHREERYWMTVLPEFRGQRMLDLACGTGRWLQKCIDLGIQPSVGVDISQSMLRMAAMKPGLSQRIALADCTALPFANDTFDLVVCSFAVWHISNLNLMGQELARVTKPRGTVLLSDLHPEAHAHGWRTGFRDGNGPRHIESHPLTVAELISIFGIVGLDCVKFEALWLGEPEASIFSHASKAHQFSEALCVPAVAAFQFRRAADSE